MAVQLNTQENTQHTHEGFYNGSVMTAPRAESRPRISCAELMDVRLAALTSGDAKMIAEWWDEYFFLDDAFVMDTDGRAKVSLDSMELRHAGPAGLRLNGGLYVAYDRIDGVEFTPEELACYTNRYLTKRQAKINPVWQALARGQHRLDDYVDAAFAMAREYLDYSENMAISLPRPSSVALLRPCIIYGTSNRSRLACDRDL